jgi:hypothetical protein
VGGRGSVSTVVTKIVTANKQLKLLIISDKINSMFVVFVTEAPTVTLTPDAAIITRELGESLEVTCSANGNPEPTVIWFKKDDETDYPVDSKDIRQVKGGKVIVVWSLDETYYGVYTCRANNTYGNSTVSVTVGELEVIDNRLLEA